VILGLTAEQAAHLRRACGTARYAYNWGLAEWKRMNAAGEKPSMMKVKAAFNAHRTVAGAAL
jgi:putative transposase